MNPKYTLAKGSPWIVSLPPGGTHDLELPLQDFISSMSYANLDVSVASGGRFVLEAPPAPEGAAAVWSGRVEAPIDACR